MTRMNTYKTYLFGLAAGMLVAALLALPASASAETDTGWQIRFYAAAIDMSDAPSGTNDYSGSSFDLDVGAGVGFNAEYRFTPRLGVDLGILSGAGVDVETGTSWTGNPGWMTSDTVTFTPLTLGLDIHLTPDERVDFYVCPLVAMIQYGSLAVRNGPTGVSTEWDFDEDFAVGAALGLGIPFGQNRWSFETSLTYLESSIDGSNRDGLRLGSDYDSTIFGFGFGYRFGQRAG
ncbi:MAG: porin family protein [bacterium]|nr:porin family protein [bacterium]